MQDRGTKIQDGGQLGRVNIRTLAILRSDEVTKRGGDPEPWLDPSRDFFREDYEELADSFYYKTCNMKRNAGRRYLLLKLSRWLIELSYNLTLLAEETPGNDVKRGKWKGGD